VNADRILDAAEVVNWLAEQARGVNEGERRESLQMALALQLVGSYLVGYAGHLVDGMEPYDALVSAIRGDTELPQRTQDFLKALNWPHGASGLDVSKD